MSILFKLSSFLIFLFLIQCDDNQETFETISKTRALGVKPSQVAETPSDTGENKSVTLTFYLVTPTGVSLVLPPEPYSDGDNQLYESADLSYTDGSETSTTYGDLTIWSFDANLPIPETAFNDIALFRGFISLRYGFRVSSNDGEEEIIVGNYLLYNDGADQLGWQNPTISITTPTKDESVSPVKKLVDLKGTLVNPNDENTRIGWLVSKGKVRSRRGIETKWEIEDPGNHTIILTARGRKSSSFAFDVITVTVP